jgi:DNA-binding NarL/FixJ family response regulator
MPKMVLIIEDNDQIRRGLVRLVSLLGHEPVSASTVEEGLKKLAFKPSHLLVDLHLQDAPGTTVLHHIRQNGLPIKVAIVSDTRDEALLTEAQRAEPEAAIIPKGRWDDLTDWITK